MATFLRTRLDVILPLVLAKLQAVTGFPPERCFPSQADTLPDSQADQYLVVKIEDDSHDLATWQGAGRIDTREIVPLAVTVRTRLALDETGHDLVYLVDASLGHLRLRHRVKDALIDFMAEDGSGNALTMPLKPLPGRRVGKDDKKKGWGTSVVRFELEYELDLDLAPDVPAALRGTVRQAPY